MWGQERRLQWVPCQDVRISAPQAVGPRPLFTILVPWQGHKNQPWLKIICMAVYRCTIYGTKRLVPLNRRRISRLSQLHKIVYHHTPAIQIPSYYLPTQYPTRQLHQYHFIIPTISTTAYHQSFFPKTVKEWNNIPISIIENSSSQNFINSLRS